MLAQQRRNKTRKQNDESENSGKRESGEDCQSIENEKFSLEELPIFFANSRHRTDWLKSFEWDKSDSSILSYLKDPPKVSSFKLCTILFLFILS